VIVEEGGERIEVDLDSDISSRIGAEHSLDAAGMALPEPLRIAHQLFQRGVLQWQPVYHPDRQRALTTKRRSRHCTDQGTANVEALLGAASVFTS